MHVHKNQLTVSISETAGTEGSVTFNSLNPGRTRAYKLQIEGSLPGNTDVEIRRKFYVGKQYSVKETQIFHMRTTKLTPKLSSIMQCRYN